MTRPLSTPNAHYKGDDLRHAVASRGDLLSSGEDFWRIEVMEWSGGLSRVKRKRDGERKFPHLLASTSGVNSGGVDISQLGIPVLLRRGVTQGGSSK